MPTGSITAEQVDFVETWENVAQSTNYVIKLDSRGEEKHEAVTGRRKFTLTTQERMITQEKILHAKHDPFLNGSFRPVVTPDDITIETNPNALSDEDIVNIFGASKMAWGEWLQTVDSEATLRRMMDLANEHEDSIPLARYNQLTARLAEVTGGPRHATQRDEDQYRSLAGDGDKGDRKKAAKRAMTSATSTSAANSL